jgi:hypothetical protein
VIDAYAIGLSQGSAGGDGVIGGRRLVAIQTFEIARLTTHPVPIVPGCFVAVTGEGPKGDSNGSGKTTFLSAVSLLLCDPQWRLDIDGRHASGLLFQPDAAGLDAASGRAPRGYVVGVFAAADLTDEQDFVTVWVRISRTPPFVQMRWNSGLVVVHRATEQEQADSADAVWESLPPKSECGSRQMTRALYGTAPRCLAYLDTSIRPSVPSLLSQQMTAMSPTRIGEALIALTGREHLLANESRERRRHADQLDELVEREQNDQRQRLTETVRLAELRRRDLARGELAESQRRWELYLAQGLLEKEVEHATQESVVTEIKGLVDEAEEAVASAKNVLEDARGRTDLREAVDRASESRQTVTDLIAASQIQSGKLGAELETALKRRSELVVEAEGDDGRPVEIHREETESAEEAAGEAKNALGRATEAHDRAKTRHEAAKAGRGGRVGEALALLDEVVSAVSLVDVVTLDETVRTSWEPRLSRYQDAVVVAPDDEDVALQALSLMPGAVVVLADGALETSPASPHPAGITSTVPLSGFLRALAERQGFEAVPDRVQDRNLGEAILGGFKEPFTGRSARIALALAEEVAAWAEVTRLVDVLHIANVDLQRHQALLSAATAIVELKKVRSRIRELETNIGLENKRRDGLQQQWIEADRVHSQAASARHNHTAVVKGLAGDLEQKETQRGSRKREHKKAIEALERINLVGWRVAWADTPTLAAQLVQAAGAGGSVKSATWWLNRTASAFRDALRRIADDVVELAPGIGELVDDIDGVEGRLASSPPDRAVFATLIRPVRDRLDATAEHDAVLHDRIITGQQVRERDITEARRELEKLARELNSVQDMVENSVETALRAISRRLDRLDQDREGGYGAELDIEIVRPVGPEAAWEWRVTPKWRRSPSGGLVSYKEVANGAQVKVFAIQLVLAALLADESVPGRLLVLDELGNSLGDANRKDVLSALHRVAEQQGVTILGTCQDSVILDAAGVCGQILWFSHASATEPYNRPTRSWGFDPGRERVELTASWLREGRTGD